MLLQLLSGDLPGQSRHVLVKKNPQPTKPPKTPTKRNCRSNLIIQAEQRIEVLNPLLLWKAIVIFDDHNAFTSAEVFPFVKQNPNSIPGQCQPLNN